MKQSEIKPEMFYRCSSCEVAAICKYVDRLAHANVVIMDQTLNLPDGLRVDVDLDCRYHIPTQSNVAETKMAATVEHNLPYELRSAP